MFKVEIGNHGIVNVNRLPKNQTEYSQLINARKGKESLTMDKYIKVFNVGSGEWGNDLIPSTKNKPSRPEWRYISKDCFPIYNEYNNYLGFYENGYFIGNVNV